jgi:hypothetical protein
MAYLLNGIDLFNTYNILAGHSSGSNIAVQNCFNMPERTGDCYHEWGDENGVEPWTLADEIFYSGRDIIFNGLIFGTVPGINGNLNTFYSAINAATGLSIFETPYHSASGYVKSVIPEYFNGVAKVVMTFREPVVNLSGTLPASGVSNYTIDSIPFLSFGLYLSKAEALHDLPELKEQHFTKYGSEGYQITKRKNNTLEFTGFIIGSSLVDFKSKIQSLYKVLSSAGTRIMNLNGVTVVCFATSGFTVDNIILYNQGMIANFKMNLIVISVT